MNFPWLTSARVLIGCLAVVLLVLIGCQSLLAQAFQRISLQDCGTLLYANDWVDSKQSLSSQAPVAKSSTDESSINQTRYGKFDSRYAVRLSNQARVLAQSGEFKNAEKEFREVVKIDEKTLGMDNPALIGDLSGLSQALVFNKKFDEAESTLSRLVNISKKNFGENSPRITRDLSLLAIVYLNQKKFDKAEGILTSLVQINNRVDGPDALVVAVCLNNLGMAYLEQGKEALAYSCLSKAVDTASRKEFSTLPESWSIKNNFDDFNKKLEDKYVTANEDSSARFPADAFLKADFLRKQRQLPEAEALLKKHIDTASGACSSLDRVKFFASLNNIAYEQGKDDEAIFYGTIAAKILDRIKDNSAITALWKVNVHSYLALSFERQASIVNVTGKSYLLKNAQSNFEQAIKTADTCRDGVSKNWTTFIKTQLELCKKQKLAIANRQGPGA